MKKHELLKHAYDNYPKGTKFKSFSRGDEIISTGVFYIGKRGIVASGTLANSHTFRFDLNKWAEIISDKKPLAIKVENEQEFTTLMKYYESLGWKDRNGDSPLTNTYKDIEGLDCLISFEDGFIFPNYAAVDSGVYSPKNFDIQPFEDFASIHGIRKPLLVSEDGVELFEGDEYIYIRANSLGEWVEILPARMCLKQGCLTNPKEYKAFSTKEAAEKWIEEQNKPKEIEIDLETEGCFKLTAIILGNKVEFKVNGNHCGVDSLTLKDIRSINNALKTLSK